MCVSVLSERCILNVLKLRGIKLTKLEGKTLQFVLMKNKILHTLDLSFCQADNPATLDYFLSKLNKYCNIRYFTMENIQPELSPCMEQMGLALAENIRLEILILRNNPIKWVPYCKFWENL